MKTTPMFGAAFISAILTAAPVFAAQYGSYGAAPMPQTSAPRSTGQAQATSQQQVDQSADPTKLKTHIPKVTPQSVKAIQALQTTVNANNTAAIPGALAAAQAAAKTGDDKYFIGLLQLKAAATTKDQSAIAASLEALVASGGAAPDEQFSLYYNLAQSYTALKQYDKAAEVLFKAAKVEGHVGSESTTNIFNLTPQELEDVRKKLTTVVQGGKSTPTTQSVLPN